jgi:hypothetical protein
MNKNEIRYYVNTNTNLILKSSGNNYKTKSSIKKGYSQQNKLLPAKLSSNTNPKRKIGASFVGLLLFFSLSACMRKREGAGDGGWRER